MAFTRRRNHQESMNMFCSRWLFILLFFAFAHACHAAAEPLLRKDWISLTEWAKDNDFNLICTGKNELFTLTNQSWTLSFKTDSQLATINGIDVWLNNPVTAQDGRVCISSLDLGASINPLLFPETNSFGATIRTICLDPGHGGRDTGGMFGQSMEKQYTLPLVEELAGKLETAGFKVILTRTNDTYIELKDRPGLANRQKADLFISLHFNIGPPDAKGVEVYCLTPAGARSTNTGKWGNFEGWGNNTSLQAGNHRDGQNMLLAYQLQKSLVESLPANDRGLRRARFEVLRTATMPAVLVEGGFLTNADDRKKIEDPKYRSKLAEAILRGVLQYKEFYDCHLPQAVPHLNTNG